MLVQAKTAELMETGRYKAKVKAITPETGQYGEQLKWQFEVIEEPYAGQTLSGWTNLSMNTTGKLVLWGCAALNETPSDDTEFDTDDLVGKTVELTVIEKTGKDGKVYNKIEDCRAVRKGKAKPKPAAEEIDPVDDPFDKD